MKNFDPSLIFEGETRMKSLESYSQHSIFFVTYDWAE
jgi:hypothetical protein